jgi:hypothetical protein
MTVCEIRLGRHVALIDEQDAPLLAGLRLEASPRPSARRGGRERIYVRARLSDRWAYVHRLIMAPPAGFVVDHIDGDGLDNTRANLRVCTHAQNLQNRIQSAWRLLPRGIYHHGPNFLVEITSHGVRRRKAGVPTLEDAIALRNCWVAELHGEFGRPSENTPIYPLEAF